MEELTLIILVSVLFAIGITIFKNWVSTPAKKDILWIFDHEGRNDHKKYLHVVIDVIAFFALGVLFGFIYKLFLAVNNSFPLAVAAMITTLACYFFTYLLLGKINTIAILDETADKKSIYFILIIWVILGATILGFSEKFNTSNIFQMTGILSWHIFFSAFALILIMLTCLWKFYCLRELREMTGPIDIFIRDSFNYSQAISLIRDTELAQNLNLDPMNLSLGKDVHFKRLLAEVSKRMENNEVCKDFFNTSGLFNFVHYSFYTRRPVPAIICTGRLMRVAYPNALFLPNRHSLALLQHLTKKKEEICIALNCPKTGLNMIEEGKIIRIDFKRELVVQLKLYRSRSDPSKEDEEIQLGQKHILWIE